MNFSKPEKVGQLITLMSDAERPRADIRKLIVDLANGDPPFTKQEAQDNHIRVNCNWKELTLLLAAGRRQYENAFLKSGNAFTVRVPDAPPSKKDAIGTTLTSEISRVMKRSRPYLHTQRSKFASIVLHGPGPQMWEDQDKWCPFFVPIEDLRVPTNTELTLENLNYFAVRRTMTPGKLYRKTLGKGANMDPGWQLKPVKILLDRYKDLYQNEKNYNFSDNPEKMAEVRKQNAGLDDSDSAPTINFWDFYFQDDDSGKSEWHRRILFDNQGVIGKVDDASNSFDWIYKTDKPFAENLDQILHIQFGDGNNKPPFVYHSVRSLGYLLYDVCQMMNRLRCQWTQHVFEQFLMLFTVNDPVDRNRLDKISLEFPYGMVPEGLGIVPNEQRHHVDPAIVNQLTASFKQLMGEASSAYTQDFDNGTQKERTKFEVQALMSQVTSITGGMLNLAYVQEAFAHREMCRRLCRPNTLDFEAKKFQAKIKELGIDKKWLDTDRWEIEPERVLGAGNKQLEIATAQELFGIRQVLSPMGQMHVLNRYVLSLTDDPKEANFLAPLDAAPPVSKTVHDTESLFGTLMLGIPASPTTEGVSYTEVVETMLRMMDGIIQNIKSTDNVGTPDQIRGLMNSAKYAGYYIGLLSQDPEAKAKVKAYNDELGNLTNDLKAFSQRQSEQAAKKNGNQMDPETVAKIRGQIAMLQQKLEAKDAADQQKRQHKDLGFQAEENRKNVKLAGEIHRATITATAEAATNAPENKEADKK